MKSGTQSDERYPLLMFVGDEEELRTSHVNKRGRLRNITAGAASVMNQWPVHMTSCWLTSLLITIGSSTAAIFIVLFALRNGILLGPYCNKSKSALNNENATIHLLHDRIPWCQEQLEIVEQIARNYPNWDINLVLIKNMNDDDASLSYNNNENSGLTSDSNDSQKRSKLTLDFFKTSLSNRTGKHDGLSDNESTGSLKMLFHVKRINKEKCLHCSSFQNIQQLVQRYPFVKILSTTFEDIFRNTPLYFTWQNLNLKTKLFAARILYLWEDAGVSYEIPQLSSDERVKIDTSTNKLLRKISQCVNYKVDNMNPKEVEHLRKINLVEKFVRNGNSSYRNIPFGVITIDDEGFHMETKTPCHPFLGELIIRLRQATKDIDPKDIIMMSLKLFCIKGGVRSQYCQRF